ncbi:MAG: peptide-methionine (S)-S-oxide reductase MsrA [Hyphomicrobiales bacterium]
MRRLITAFAFVILGIAVLASLPASAAQRATAILAGGCFWCVEHDFRQLAGVTQVVSGYSGGSRANPTYEDYHDTDAENPVPHVEVVEVTYDPATLSYDALLDYYFRHIDPTDGGGQFCDRGPAYRPVVFFATDAERAAADAKKTDVARQIGQPVQVDILPAAAFWPAEDYHQDYAEKNPVRYKYYRWNCGRDQRIEEVWSAASN